MEKFKLSWPWVWLNPRSMGRLADRQWQCGKRWPQQALLGLLIVVLTGGVMPGAIAQTVVPGVVRQTEIRGVWLTNIDSDVLYGATPSRNGKPEPHLKAALRRLARLNFNTIYPTVWNWGYTLYPSAVAQQVIGQAIDPHPGLQGRDMLRELVQQGHQQGLAVISWFEFGLMAPADSALAKLHPDWLTQRLDGTQIVKEGKDDRVWLNPFHPQVQAFILSLIREIVSTYAVDGLQLDDHFGLPVELGYDPLTVQLYQQTHQGAPPPSDPHDPEWLRWRADRLTEFMTQVFTTIKAANHNCLVSLSPNPQDFSYANFLQDWFTWQQRGLIDELIVQVYRTDLERFNWELSQPAMQAAREKIPVGIGILAGLKHRITPMSLIVEQVKAAREQGFAGVAFFFYETLIQERDHEFKSLFATPARRPNSGPGETS